MRVYLDGARLANAAAHLGCSVAEIAACADVLSFGGTKNGAMGVEAVVVMQAADAVNAPYLRKQHMQLSSKMRFLAAQFNALLTDGLWLRNAAHANAMATRLAAGLAEIPGVEVVYPVQADAVFARLDPDHVAALQQDWTFYIWDEQHVHGPVDDRVRHPGERRRRVPVRHRRGDRGRLGVAVPSARAPDPAPGRFGFT